MSRTVFITGTSRGIGRATAEVFAQNGWRVIAHARNETPNFIKFCSHISATPIYFDMLDTAAMKERVKELKKDKIVIDALINNAGIAHGGLFQMTPVSDIKKVFDVNLFAQMELTQLVLKIMAKENAAIVNVASVAGVDMKGGNSAYGVSKAALIAWTKVLQTELRGKVRVNAVAPGLTETDMATLMEKQAGLSMVQNSLMKRMAKPEEIANVAVFLASYKSSFINGQVIRVDGGSE